MPALRPAKMADTPQLRELLCLAPVFEFLSDGVAPAPGVVDEWVSDAIRGDAPLGLWLLEQADDPLLGCVRLSPVPDGTASAELTYVLHPDQWGRGLATAMSRAAIARAFEHETCESILAGADVANGRSVTVMKRLGMQFLRDVEYPMGPGVEYRMTRTRFASMPPGATLPFS